MNRLRLGFIRRSTLLILIAALAAGLGLWTAQRAMHSSNSLSVALANVLLLPEARPIPAFSLQGGDGSAVTNESLQGRWTLTFIGFTHCPDVCPTTLALMASAEKLWNTTLPAEQRPRILFVSVDPERDSPAHTQKYARFFSPDAIGASGDAAALEAFARSLSMVFMKAPAAEGSDPANYSIDHSAHISLLDPKGRFAGLIRPPLDAAQIASDMTAIVQHAP